MKKIFTAVAIVGFATIGISTPAAATPESAMMNQPSFWETADTDCVKVEFGDGVASFTLPESDDVTYTLLVLKAGSGASANQVIEWPLAGVEYFHETGKDLSHVIYCTMDEPES